MTPPEAVNEFITVPFERVLYTAKTHTTGGRDGGALANELNLRPLCSHERCHGE